MSNDKDTVGSKKTWYEKLHFGIGIIVGILTIIGCIFTFIDRFRNSGKQTIQNPTSTSISYKDKELTSTEPSSKSTKEPIADISRDTSKRSSSEQSGGFGFENSKESIYEQSGELTFEDFGIGLSENHIPNNSQINVDISEWNPISDIGINGNTYEGGNKVKISSASYSLGVTDENKIKSRITVPISDKTKQYFENNRFVGAFVLNREMIGKNSSGTLEIIIKNKKVFSTGIIDGNTTKAFPFNVNYGDADSIIIEANITLNGSDFIYSFVNSK